MTDPWLGRPWRLLPNRVSRFYRGGLLLDRFRGEPNSVDTDRPEDWVGSATRAWTPPGSGPTEEGLSLAELDGEQRLVAEVLASDPAAVGGADLAPFGTTGILVKLLDAGSRLPVHLHPTRAFANRHLASPFGKAEAWVVLGTRDIAGERPPEVRLGFRRDVDRDELLGWVEAADGAALREAMHTRPTRAGDVWFVPPGMPHAIGAGVFILEVQEPTDFSIVLETGGFPVRADDAHLGLGWGVTLDAVERRGLSVAALDALVVRGPAVGPVLPAAAAPFFRVERISLGREIAARPDLPARFVVGIVTAGAGTVRTAGGALPIRSGDAFGVPGAAVAGLEVTSEDTLDVLLCLSGGPPAAGMREGGS